MNCKDGCFTLCERDALLKMQELAGCEVRPCVFPTNLQRSAYFISERGHLFTVSDVAGRYVVFGPKKDTGKYRKEKYRRDGGFTHTMKIDSKHVKLEKAEKLVYCSFVLGRWLMDDIIIKFKDGNANHIFPENLYIPEETWKKGWTERMYEFTEIYEQSFKRVARIVEKRCFTTIENAEDITQAAFIYLMQRKDGPCNEAIWAYWAKLFGWRQRRRIDGRYCLIDDFYDSRYALLDKPYDVDLLQNVKGRDREYAKLWAAGVPPMEIAEMYGKSRSAVSQGINRAKEIVRNELQDEKDLLGY